MTGVMQTASKAVRIVIRVALFLFFILLALGNTEAVHFQLLPGLQWQGPLILFLLLAFLAGVLLTLIGGVSVSRLKKKRVEPRESATHAN